ncbi:MAG: hypothetical protein Q9Q40_01490 [Acidobacteriota bacterium]|nr:hypothetical protein [Acidobacteriota bacterium]
MNEAFWMGTESIVEDSLAFLNDGRGPAEMHVGRSEPGEGPMMVMVVVPGEEDAAMREGVMVPAKAAGETRLVLECLEVGFGVGIVVGDAGVVASSRGFSYFGWTSGLRRSPAAALAARIRYMVLSEQS